MITYPVNNGRQNLGRRFWDGSKRVALVAQPVPAVPGTVLLSFLPHPHGEALGEEFVVEIIESGLFLGWNKHIREVAVVFVGAGGGKKNVRRGLEAGFDKVKRAAAVLGSDFWGIEAAESQILARPFVKAQLDFHPERVAVHHALDVSLVGK